MLKQVQHDISSFSKASSSIFFHVKHQLWLLLFCLFVVACGDRAAVDESYLESESFSEFNKYQQEEYSAQVKSYESLQQYLAAYSECPMGKEWTFPLQMDANTLKENGEECLEIAAKYDRNYGARNIGHTQFGNLNVRWIALQKESAYKNYELLAATYRNDSLVGFQTIGMFRENLSEDISTRIEADVNGHFADISSFKNRGLKYPFKYDNVIESTFRIDSSGVIVKQAEQTRSYNSLPDFLTGLRECELGRRWHLPMEIHTEELENYGRECRGFTGKMNPNFTPRSIGYSQFNDFTIRWFDMKKNSFSEDRRLMAAVFRDDTLVSFQTVGVFRKHSSRHITTGIEVSQDEDIAYISTAVKRSITFPIKHENVVESVYEIDSLGTIRQYQ